MDGGRGWRSIDFKEERAGTGRKREKRFLIFLGRAMARKNRKRKEKGGEFGCFGGAGRGRGGKKGYVKDGQNGQRHRFLSFYV